MLVIIWERSVEPTTLFRATDLLPFHNRRSDTMFPLRAQLPLTHVSLRFATIETTALAGK